MLGGKANWSCWPHFLYKKQSLVAYIAIYPGIECSIENSCEHIGKYDDFINIDLNARPKG